MKSFPTFDPPPLLRNGHVQTILANFTQGRKYPYLAVRHEVELDDADTVVLHDDRPANWQPNSPTALLVHGLAGCYSSGYMIRTAGKLNDVGIRVFRMDMRSCGAGEEMSRRPYHPGISQDVRRVLQYIARLCPLSRLGVVGFSVGGNITLKMLGEKPFGLPPLLDRAVVINPPINMPLCMERMKKRTTRIYDRHLVKLLYRQFKRSKELVEHAPYVTDTGPPRGLREFDSIYASVAWGFESVDHFYEEASSLPYLKNIRVPTLLIASRDDPMVPVQMFDSLQPPETLALEITQHGGHLGFISRSGIDADRRWMDWRIVDWMQADFQVAAVAVEA